MRNHYRNDPYILTAKYPGVCGGGTCTAPIVKGDRVMRYPKSRTILCAGCTEREWPRFVAAAEDEYRIGGAW